MSRIVRYEAAREMISGRSAGDSVTITFDASNVPLRTHGRTRVTRKKVNSSISKYAMLTFENVSYRYNFVTIPLANTDTGARLMREFLSSADGQIFTFAPGSDYDGGASPSTEYSGVLTAWSEARVRVGPDRFTFNFTIEQFANAT